MEKEIVIKIDEKAFQNVINICKDGAGDIFHKAIANGTPLPKGHGDLIDKEKLKANINGWYAFMKDICKQPYMTLKQEEIIGKIDMMTPIIESDNLPNNELENPFNDSRFGG